MLLSRLFSFLGLTKVATNNSQRPLLRLEGNARKAVLRFAAGDMSAKTEALVIYQELRKQGMSCKGDPAMMFMCEVDNSNPDLKLRNIMRKQALVGDPVWNMVANLDTVGLKNS